MFKKMYLLICLLITCTCISTEALQFQMTRAECKSFDLSFSYFKNCEAKTVGSSTKINVHVVMRYKNPVDDVGVGITFYKISKTYRIPIMNETIDFCAYLKEPMLAKLFSYLAEPFRSMSNINHTCPFQHDIIVTGTYPKPILPEIPAPKGNYIVQLHVSAFKKWKATVKFHTIRT